MPVAVSMSESQQPQLKLTPKQELFVAYYCGEARFNASKAVLLAGYKTKNANDLGYQLRNAPHIRARIDEVLENNTLRAAEVLRELTDVATRELGEFVQIVATDKDGVPIAARMDARAKMTALELLGKHHALFTDKVQHSGGVQVSIVGVDVEQL